MRYIKYCALGVKIIVHFLNEIAAEFIIFIRGEFINGMNRQSMDVVIKLNELIGNDVY